MCKISFSLQHHSKWAIIGRWFWNNFLQQLQWWWEGWRDNGWIPALIRNVDHSWFLRGGHVNDVTVTVAYIVTINVIIHCFKTIICHHHLFLVILMGERKFPSFIPFQKTLWCYFDKVDKTFLDGSKIWEICLCLYHIWEGVKISLVISTF